MNPEFRRNTWLELSKERLVAFPLILGMLLWFTYLIREASFISIASVSMFLVITIWGSRLAASTFIDEIEARTWDAQRLLPLSAWSFTWGKLFGSTIFAWYGAAWLLFAIYGIGFFILKIDIISIKLINQLLLGLFTQSLAFYFSILQYRLNPGIKKFRVFFAHFSALIVGLYLLIWIDVVPEAVNANFINTTLFWYDYKISLDLFMSISLISFVFWAVIGSQRLLSASLQCSPKPWLWPFFVLYIVLYIFGFIPIITDNIHHPIIKEHYFNHTYLIYLFIAYFLVTMLTFISAFFEPKNIIYIRKLLHEIKNKHLLKAFSVTPSWVTTFPFMIILCGLVFAFITTATFSTSNTSYSIQIEVAEFKIKLFWMVSSLLLFFLRDIGLMYFLTINPKSTRAHTVTMIYLTLLYTLVPGLFSTFAFGRNYILPAFIPFNFSVDFQSIISGGLLLIAQICLCWYAVFIRYKKLVYLPSTA